MSVVGTGIGENPGTAGLHYERTVPNPGTHGGCSPARQAKAHQAAAQRRGGNAAAGGPGRLKTPRRALARAPLRNYPSRCSHERPRPRRQTLSALSTGADERLLDTRPADIARCG